MGTAFSFVSKTPTHKNMYNPCQKQYIVLFTTKNCTIRPPSKTTSSSSSLMLNAVVVHHPLPTFPVVVRRPILHAIVIRCRCLLPLSAAIANVVCRCCLPLPLSLPQPSSPLRCLRCLLPPTLVLPCHSLLPNLASRHHPPPSLSATVIVRRCHRCPQPGSSIFAANIATQLSLASLATVVPSPL
jgi:hypothetical protein